MPCQLVSPSPFLSSHTLITPLCVNAPRHTAETLQDSPATVLLSESDCLRSLSRTKPILALRSERPT